MSLPRELLLSRQGLDRVLRRFGLGEPHLTLRPVAMWFPQAERDELERQALAEFERLGLLGPRGLTDEVFESLQVLCGARVEYYGWIASHGEQRGVFVGAIGSEALLAVCEGEQVLVRQIHADDLVSEFVAQLPECAPAEFTAISAPMAEVVETLHGTGKSNGHIMQTLTRTSPAMRNLKQLVGSETTGGGELYVAVRDQLGRSRRIPYSLGYTDTAYGRALNLVQQNENGDQWATFAPGSRQAIGARLTELRASL